MEAVAVNVAKLFHTVLEHPERLEAEVTGSIPKWLNGSLLKNGPGIFEVGPDSYNHWFDGLAIVQGFHIENGKVYFNSKYLRSETYQRNMSAQRIVVGEFGTLPFPDPCKSIFQRYFSYFFPGKFTDNDLVNFVQCGDEIYASSETAVLNRIDPKSLDTIEQVDMHKYVATNTATAHPHYDKEGNTYNMGSSIMKYNIILTPNPLNSREKSANALEKSKIVATIPAKSAYMSYYHSFGMSKDYIVFVETPLLMNPWKLTTAYFTRTPFSEGFTWYPGVKVAFHVVGINDGKLSEIKYTSDEFFTFHHANAYEKDDCLFVDLACYTDGSVVKAADLQMLRKGFLSKSNYASLWRFVLPLKVPENAQVGDNLLKNKSFNSAATATLQADGSVHYMEFPRINYEKCNGLPYRYCYGAGLTDSGSFLLNELLKLDLETKEVKVWAPHNKAQFVGEPVFVPKPGAQDEDDGVILSPISDVENDNENFLLILNGKTFEELARAKINRFIAAGFHAHFVADK